MAYYLLVEISFASLEQNEPAFIKCALKKWAYKYTNHRSKLNYHILNAAIFSLVKENSTLYLILFPVYFIFNQQIFYYNSCLSTTFLIL